MTWVKLHDDLPTHPKFIGMSDAALAAFVRGLLYSSLHLLDGELPAAAQKLLGSKRGIAELVERDIWRETLAGWSIVHYGKHQRLRSEIEADRAKASDRQRAARERKAGVRTLPGVTDVSRRDFAVSHAGVTRQEKRREETEEILGTTQLKELADPQPVDNPLGAKALRLAARATGTDQ